ncbi:uncharacterized protein RB166_003204 [Leptodactylus fuscus]
MDMLLDPDGNSARADGRDSLSSGDPAQDKKGTICCNGIAVTVRQFNLQYQILIQKLPTVLSLPALFQCLLTIPGKFSFSQPEKGKGLCKRGHSCGKQSQRMPFYGIAQQTALFHTGKTRSVNVNLRDRSQ